MTTSSAGNTKLVVAVVPDDLTNRALEALLGAGCRVTRIASTGGFLRKGNTTLLAGVSEDEVEAALAALRTACGARTRNAEQGRVTVFVVNVGRSERL